MTYLKKLFFVLISFGFVLFPQFANGQNPANFMKQNKFDPDKDIGIAGNEISVPVGMFILVRNKTGYCAVKLTSFKYGESEFEAYATYESYYQDDRSGDFTNKNVKVYKGELSKPKSFGIGRFSFEFGAEIDIICGPIKLEWSQKNWIFFYSSKQGESDQGIELSPTKWTEITHINISDTRLKWYKYENKTGFYFFPLDKLWEDKK